MNNPHEYQAVCRLAGPRYSHSVFRDVPPRRIVHASLSRVHLLVGHLLERLYWHRKISTPEQDCPGISTLRTG